jgi:hypothetical protein
MRAFYERLKANGKHSTAAQIAVMRKIYTATKKLDSSLRCDLPK